MTSAKSVLDTCPQDRAIPHICATTGRIMARQAGYEDIAAAVLETCRLACRACADECGRRASGHQHCQVGAEACRRCGQACSELLGSLG